MVGARSRRSRCERTFHTSPAEPFGGRPHLPAGKRGRGPLERPMHEPFGFPSEMGPCSPAGNSLHHLRCRAVDRRRTSRHGCQWRRPVWIIGARTRSATNGVRSGSAGCRRALQTEGVARLARRPNGLDVRTGAPEPCPSGQVQWSRIGVGDPMRRQWPTAIRPHEA